MSKAVDRLMKVMKKFQESPEGKAFEKQLDRDHKKQFGWTPRKAKIHKAVREFSRTDNTDR